MSTNWDDAPEWAKFKATDADGQSFWYEHAPELGHRQWNNAQQCISRVDKVKPPISIDWLDSLEERP
jgi:hypothetical protein